VIICFDLGGVLLRICRSWPEACRAAGLEVRNEPADRAAADKIRELSDEHGTGEITLNEWAAALSEAMQSAYSPDELKRIHRAWLLEEHRGAFDLIEELHRFDIATACLSNTTETHWARLVHRDGSRPLEGPPEYPAIVRLKQHFASHLMRLAKPDPAIYRRFELLTGHQGKSVFFFDDTQDNVAAARAIGWQAEWIDVTRDPVTQMREYLRAHGVLPQSAHRGANEER
jgi:putative hydrolase of the HAD superfamily